MQVCAFVRLPFPRDMPNHCPYTAAFLSSSFLHASSIVCSAKNTYNHIPRDFTIIISVCPFVKHIGTVFRFLNQIFPKANQFFQEAAYYAEYWEENDRKRFALEDLEIKNFLLISIPFSGIF